MRKSRRGKKEELKKKETLLLDALCPKVLGEFQALLHLC
jgi:hypothetical protein